MYPRIRWLFRFSKIVHRRNFQNVSPANSKVMKVAVLGAAGKTGRPKRLARIYARSSKGNFIVINSLVGRCLSLLLKRSSIVDELAVYDVLPTEGLALELNHIDAPCKVNGYSGLSNIEDALRRAKVVVITAGNPARYKERGGEILKTNANVLADLIPHVVRYAPRAMLALVTSPVNILIPMIAEMYKKAGVYDLNNLFGVTTLDSVRSNTFVAQVLGVPPESIVVPVIGGNCEKTCIPLFSHMKPRYELTNEEISRLTLSVKLGNEELLKTYNGNGSPSLGMAFAAARFCVSLCKGLRGLPGVVECAYVRSCVVPDVTYFSSPLELGPNGIQRNLGVPVLNDYECKMLDSAIPLIQAGIKIGEALLCLRTFPDKVTELNSLIDEYKPQVAKKSKGNVTRKPAPSSRSINSITPDYYFHDVGSCYSSTPTYRDRWKSGNGICKRKYRPYSRRRSRPLAHILTILVNRLAICTRAVFVKPSKYIVDSVTAMFLQKEHSEHVQCGSSTVWNSPECKGNRSIVNSLISTMRPAAVRLIADTTILKRWLQALALASIPPNQSLSQAIRTTETIDGWAYELFFHLKYLQVINFPCEIGQDDSGIVDTLGVNDANITDDVMHTNLWHRIVQLRDHYVILFEGLRSNDQFLESDETSKNVSSGFD